jgi:hypothetical protein
LEFVGNLGNLLTPLEKIENKFAKLEKLELEILEKSPYRTFENNSDSSPVPRGPPSA